MSAVTRERAAALVFRLLCALVSLVELVIRVLDLGVMLLEAGIRKVAEPRRSAPPEDRDEP